MAKHRHPDLKTPSIQRVLLGLPDVDNKRHLEELLHFITVIALSIHGSPLNQEFTAVNTANRLLTMHPNMTAKSRRAISAITEVKKPLSQMDDLIKALMKIERGYTRFLATGQIPG